ncbi:hypothetical protein AbHV_ORF56 [Abalone herpesvirus Victoria/AUS/2009]|uniref:Uncharacterized protein n=1 Tax=Abalone herpesvirus (isolate Abalone/Australia/Victoria/2009) TaxID=1241371 RepID=K4JV56_ABHV|nr:hypothetical protein AbHV_ORF56 [Abalone herpesvirus Victoria/AUS/2009]AFU90066.1 hypothetical protein AbHV_ORF56 [Abalone herpesvirus Victoria/AUS/2009]UCX57044.1 ORF53 [Haliotid herpesvirus 1]
MDSTTNNQLITMRSHKEAASKGFLSDLKVKITFSEDYYTAKPTYPSVALIDQRGIAKALVSVIPADSEVTHSKIGVVNDEMTLEMFCRDSKDTTTPVRLLLGNFSSTDRMAFELSLGEESLISLIVPKKTYCKAAGTTHGDKEIVIENTHLSVNSPEQQAQRPAVGKNFKLTISQENNVEWLMMKVVNTDETIKLNDFQSRETLSCGFSFSFGGLGSKGREVTDGPTSCVASVSDTSVAPTNLYTSYFSSVMSKSAVLHFVKRIIPPASNVRVNLNFIMCAGNKSFFCEHRVHKFYEGDVTKTLYTMLGTCPCTSDPLITSLTIENLTLLNASSSNLSS